MRTAREKEEQRTDAGAAPARPMAGPPPIPGATGPVVEYWTPAPKQRNNWAVAGLVLGIGSLLLTILAGVLGTMGLVFGVLSVGLAVVAAIPGVICSLVGICCGLAGIRRAKVIGGRGQALAVVGLVLSCLATWRGIAVLAQAVRQIYEVTTAPSFVYRPPTISDGANASTVIPTLNVLRVQLISYKLQHQARHPTMDQMKDWSVLLQKTDADGTVNPAGRYGPYLAVPPVNPLTGSSAVVPADKPVSPAGWVYDPATGRIRAAVKAPTPGLPPADVVVVPQERQ